MRQTLARSLQEVASVEISITAFLEKTQQRKEEIVLELDHVRKGVRDLLVLRKTVSVPRQPRLKKKIFTYMRRQKFLEHQLQLVDAQLFNLDQIYLQAQLRISCVLDVNPAIPTIVDAVEVLGAPQNLDLRDIVMDVNGIIDFLRSPDDIQIMEGEYESEFAALDGYLRSHSVRLDTLIAEKSDMLNVS
jgi:hypothetical protein